MKNSEYWARRMKNMEDALSQETYGYVENLEDQFNAAIKEIDIKMRAWYQRFAVNNGVTYADAQKLLTSTEMDEFRWSVQEYIKHGKENALSGQWIKELENASARVHISRLDALKLQIQQQAETLAGKTLDSAGKAIDLSYTGSYYHTAYELQRGLGVGWTMQALNTDTISKVLSRPWTTDNQTFRDRCWTNKGALVQSVNKQLSQMIIRGEAPDKAIAAISKQFEVSKQKAGRLVMTESAYFSSAAQQDCYKELDVEQYRVVCSFDKNTCSLCADLDGKVFKMSEYEVGLTAPPFHPWCRCCTCPYFEDMAGIGERWTRNPDGSTAKISPDTTYADWYKLHVKPVETLPKAPKGGTIKKPAAPVAEKKTIADCKTPAEVDELFKSQNWFQVSTINGKTYDSNALSSLQGCDLEAAKGIYGSCDELFKKYPQLIGKLNGVNTAQLSGMTYAQCSVGLGHGGVAVNVSKYSDAVKLARSYASDLAAGFHPAGTDWTAIVTHEFGHAIDDYLTNSLQVAGLKNHWQPKYLSAALRPKVMKACGLKVADTMHEVSGYATKDHFEWFAECFAEYIKSDNPRAVAKEFGKQFEEILKGAGLL